MRLLAIGFVLFLAACGEPSTGEGSALFATCSTVADAPTADTIIGAKIDGRPFLVDSAAPMFQFDLDTATGYFRISGQAGGDGPVRRLQIDLYHFHGVQGYSIQDLALEGFAVYDCNDGVQHTLWSSEVLPDTLRVEAYDSSTGQVKGTFKFLGHSMHLAPGDTGLSEVTEGVFNGTVFRHP